MIFYEPCFNRAFLYLINLIYDACVFSKSKKGSENMTDKQRKFADEYLIDCNATRAYKTAYPNIKSDKAASASATRLLGNVKVKSYIEKRLEQISNEKTADAQEVMEYLTSVLRGESHSTICVTEGTGEGCTKARLLEKPPDERERLKAAELLGKRFGLYTDKVDVSNAVPVVISGEDEIAE